MDSNAIECHWSIRLSAWLGAILLMLSLSVGAEQVAQVNAQGNSFAYSKPVWELSNFQITSQGQVNNLREGKFTRLYMLEADAMPANGIAGQAEPPRFQLTMDVFSPNYDMGFQKQGKFYVQGRWDLTGLDSNSGVLSGSIHGRLKAELDFDPTVETGDWKAILQVPMSQTSPTGGGRLGMRPVRGAGELTFASADSAQLALDMKLWPKF